MGFGTPTASDGGGAVTPQRPFRRRPPSLKEQTRRKAWGREWGRILSATAKHLHGEGK